MSASPSPCLCVQTAALQHAEEERVRLQEDLKRQLESMRLEASSQETVNARLQEQLQQVGGPLQQLSTPLICMLRSVYKPMVSGILSALVLNIHSIPT